jgi:hypothetical protein
VQACHEVYRHGLVDRAAERKRIERDCRVGAERLANLPQVRGIPAEIGDREKGAVAGAHADQVAPADRAPTRAFGAEIESQRYALHSSRLRGPLRGCGLRRDGRVTAPRAAAALRERVASGQRQGEGQRGAPATSAKFAERVCGDLGQASHAGRGGQHPMRADKIRALAHGLTRKRIASS